MDEAQQIYQRLKKKIDEIMSNKEQSINEIMHSLFMLRSKFGEEWYFSRDEEEKAAYIQALAYLKEKIDSLSMDGDIAGCQPRRKKRHLFFGGCDL